MKVMPWGETLKVELDVGFITDEFILDQSVLDGTDTLDGSTEFVDITEFVNSVGISRGRTDQFSTFPPGTCGLVINDSESGRSFDPANTASPYYEGDLGIAPRRFMRVYGGSAGTEPLWAGRVQDLDIEYQKPNISIARITGVDDLADFGKTNLLAFTPSQTRPDLRVAEILDRPEVAYSTATRSLSTACVATLGTVAYSDNTNVKAAIDAVAQAEDGRFFMAKDPAVGVVLQPRIQFSFDSPTVFFSDAGTAIPYVELTTRYGAETLINRAQIGVQGAAISTATSQDSIDQYGVSTYALNDLPLANAAQGLTLAQNIITKYANPVSRFEEIVVLCNGLTEADREAVVALEIGDIIQVTRTFTTGSPLTVTQDVFVESIRHEITPSQHRITIGLGQAQLLLPFLLDTSELNNPVYGLG
jgi:hypothetical protein